MELNSETKFILGAQNWLCARIARRLVQLGHNIAPRCEEEQAYVINWMLELYEQHGDKWRTHCEAYLKGA